jgi:hypothetical protein
MINLRIQQAKLTVDDASPGFARSGEADFWKTVDAGFAGRATWTLNEQGKTINTGRWTPPLERPGVYRVEAYIPSFSDRLAQSYSSSVSYTLSHMGLETEIEKNQANFAGKWLDLGVYYFEADGNEYLTLSDQTGEPAGTTAVVFDAVRWTPVVDYDRAIDAAAGSRFTYDLVLPGETAVLEFKVTNAGLTPWEGAIFALYPDADNPDGAREALFLKERVMPGETTSWMVRVPVVNVSGVQTVRYRMQLAGEPFGETITGYIFILPEQLQGIEEELRGKIDGLLAQGEQAAKDLAQQVLAEIQKKLEERARKAIDDLLLQCQMPVALLIMGVLFPVYKRRKRD